MPQIISDFVMCACPSNTRVDDSAMETRPVEEGRANFGATAG